MNEQAPIRILLVDDHPLMRRGMRDLLAMEDDLLPVGEAGTGEEALRLVDELDPDLILLDLNMPGMDGLETLQRLREAKVDARIILFTVSDDQSHVLEALRQGADGYLLKDFVLDELLCALSTVLRGERYLSPRIRHMEIDSTSKRNVGKLLTARQLEILRLVASGKTTKEIARNLSISPKTVEFHRSRLMERTGANDVTGLTRFALQNGVLC